VKMKPWLKWTIRVISGLGLLAFGALLLLYLQIIRPISQHTDLTHRLYQGEKVDPTKLREAAERSLRWVVWHDAFLTLEEYGDQSSIPILIRSLHRVDKPDKEGGIVCTSTHCRSALRKLSVQDFGYDVDAWEAWWRTRSTEPLLSPDRQ
jgi:hypothetical protein